MGQQQLLLIVLGVIMVGIAVIVGITLFQDYSASTNRDAVTNDLINLAARAQAYYRRPTILGGGGNKFAGLTMGKLAGPTAGTTWINPNGTYSIDGTVTDSSVTLKGIGVEKSGGSLVEVHCRVTSDNVVTTVLK